MHLTPLIALILSTRFANSLDIHVERKAIQGGAYPGEEYPFFARPLDSNGMFTNCGAFLIAPEYVLTSSNCTGIDAVQIGALCGLFTPQDNCGQDVQLIQANSTSIRNKLQLIKLADPSTIEPVDIDLDGIADSYTGEESGLWAIGLGAENINLDKPDSLRHVELKYVNQTRCIDYFGNSVEVSEETMCIADIGKDQGACVGDEGGPLYDSNNKVVVGINSSGGGCGNDQKPSIFAKVSAEVSESRKTDVQFFSHRN